MLKPWISQFSLLLSMFCSRHCLFLTFFGSMLLLMIPNQELVLFMVTFWHEFVDLTVREVHFGWQAIRLIEIAIGAFCDKWFWWEFRVVFWILYDRNMVVMMVIIVDFRRCCPIFAEYVVSLCADWRESWALLSADTRDAEGAFRT